MKPSMVSLISAIVVYAAIIISVNLTEQRLDNELAAFDLNGDGIFSGKEITPESEAAMYRVTADTGRTFAPFTGAIFSLIYFLLLWAVVSAYGWIKRRHASSST